MRAIRQQTFSVVAWVLAVVLGAVALMIVLGRYDAGSQPGQTWRRGFLGGEQIQLVDDGRYQLQRWSCVGQDETYESGTWAKIGDVVSLVPTSGSRQPYLMRMIAKDGDMYLMDPSATAAGRTSEDEMFERLD